MKVAVIGLGNMGSGIAHCVLQGGFDLRVWNRTSSKMERLIQEGAKAAASAKEAASGADVVMTSLMDDNAILDTLQGESGILAGMKQDAIHLCVATISPECADRLEQLHREHGSHYVSGPVMGRPDAAAAGQLMTYLAGPEEAIERVGPICQTYAKKTTTVSNRPRLANCLKLCINFNGAALIEIIGETYVLAEKCGLPLEILVEFYQQSIFAHPALKMYAEKIRSRNFLGEGGFAMTGGLKDVQLMLSTAHKLGIGLEVGTVIERKLKTGIDAGLSQADWSASYEVTRKEAGLN